ncbi:MAG: UvrD-helicase domain-containing protein [Mariniphaga sp.]|nr:UvrD-helicase domain-containing protein [Mariniphaga sp.]
MFDYLEELNAAQKEAVIKTEGPSLVVAGAGSGKTRVLTYRIAHLIKQGTRPSTILALTFTNKAAREMKDRIAAVVSENTARYLWMGTFHSVFARILRSEHEAIGYPSNYTIYDAADSKSLIKTIIKDFQLDDKIYKPGVVSSRISMAKNNLVTPNTYSENTEIQSFDKSIRMPRISEVYKEYSKRCFLSGSMDFDDLLLKTNILFRDNPDILKKYQERFDYILVDEYQDTNYAQYLIIKKLAAIHNNITVVGDDAQSIYSFRGARIENILNFRNDYPGYKTYKLEQNYRSTKNIVNAANSIISKNKRQIQKKVFSEKEEGSLIKILQALTDNEEGFLIANEITETQLRVHFKFEDYAILYRTNAQSRIFEESLRKRNIPYKIYGGLSFYQRKEIKDLLGYFRLVVNPADNEAIKRIINYPTRGIGATTLSKLEQAAVQNETSIWNIIKVMPKQNIPSLNRGTLAKISVFIEIIKKFQKLAVELDAYTMASTIAEKTGFLKDLYNDKSPEGLSRYENLQELLNALKEFTISGKEEGNPNFLSNYMEEVSLLTDMDNDKPEDKNKVSLMTAHSAKGLEFKNVFVVGLEENLFPSNQSGQKKTPYDLEEERRLFYVAITRAKENVYLSFAQQRYKWGNLEFCTPSRFIAEVDEKYIDMPMPQSNTSVSSGNGFGMNQNYRQNTIHKSPKPTTLSGQNNFARKLVSLKRSDSGSSQQFTGDDPMKIVPGISVEHQRFGIGKVLKVEGIPPNLKATVFFQNAGQKQLLLKFAKLKIVL